MKKLTLVTAIALASSTAMAQDYQFDVGANYIDGESNSVDFDGFSLDGTAFFSIVDTSKGPLNEASFLDKASSVTLNYSSLEADVDGADSSDDIEVSTRIVLDNDFIVEGSYTDLDEADDSILRVGVGTYLTDTLDLIVSYEDQDEAEASRFLIELDGYGPLEGDTGFAYDLGIGYVDLDEDDGFELIGGLAYYFTRELSVGANLDYVTTDDNDVLTTTLEAVWFIMPNIELNASYLDESQDGDGNAFSIGAAFRF